jgi:hypothetical protein
MESKLEITQRSSKASVWSKKSTTELDDDGCCLTENDQDSS